MAACAESPHKWEAAFVLHFRERGEERLTDQGMIAIAVLTSRNVEEQAQRAFPEKPGRDFPDIVGGGEGDGTCRGQLLTSLWKE